MTSIEEQAAEEARLASRLRDASDHERAGLYGITYDRIYEMHLSRSGETIEEQSYGASVAQLPLLERLTRTGDRVLEIGCGSGLLSIGLARLGRDVTGVEVSRVILDRAEHYAEGRARFVRVDGVALPFPDDSFDFAFSVQVVEHLHERDARSHLSEVRRIVGTGGCYLINTPNGRYENTAKDRWGVETTDDVHLHEFSYGELRVAGRTAGFPSMRVIRNMSRGHIVPGWAAVAAERVIRNRRVAERVGVSAINALLC